MKIAPPRLTKAQREVRERVLKGKDPYVKPHVSGTGTRCFRIMNGDHRPLEQSANVKYNVFVAMCDKCLFERVGNLYLPTQLLYDTRKKAHESDPSGRAAKRRRQGRVQGS